MSFECTLLKGNCYASALSTDKNILYFVKREQKECLDQDSKPKQFVYIVSTFPDLFLWPTYIISQLA